MLQIIGARDAPEVYNYRLGITAPQIEEECFEIKKDYITLLERKPFHGLPSENPYYHLRDFERICNLTRIPGVSEDALKLRLFPFSLTDLAKEWETQLPPDSIITWDDCKTAFLSKFFPLSRTTYYRNLISGFTQDESETFPNAWERFKQLLNQCPHHRFNKALLLNIFYNGALLHSKRTLNTASKGSFLCMTVEDGWNLVENLANSEIHFTNQIYITPYAEPNKNEKAIEVRKPLLLLENGEEEVRTEEICYMQSYTSNMQLDIAPFEKKEVALFTDQQQPTNDIYEFIQYYSIQKKEYWQDLSDFKTEIEEKLERNVKDLNEKFHTISSRLDILEAKHQEDSRFKAEAISLRSGRNLPPRTPIYPVPEDSNIQVGG